MAVADIFYFASLASAALISTAVLLRQYLHGDLAEPARGAQRADAAPAARATPGRRLAGARADAVGTHRRRAA
jgi:hypothetical protein